MQGYPEDGNKREYLSGSEIAGDFEPAIFMVWKGRAEASVSIVQQAAKRIANVRSTRLQNMKIGMDYEKKKNCLPY